MSSNFWQTSKGCGGEGGRQTQLISFATFGLLICDPENGPLSGSKFVANYLAGGSVRLFPSAASTFSSRARHLLKSAIAASLSCSCCSLVSGGGFHC
jgi:hypothetical protein